MSNPMNRRQFMKAGVHTVAAASVVAGIAPSLLAAEKPLFKISLAQWSLNRRLRGREGEKLDNLEFAKVARSLDIEAIEYVNQFFMDKAKDERYLAEMKRRADGEGVKSLLIMCDREGALGDPDEAKRKQAVENHHKWADAAKYLGCHSIRVNAQSSGAYDEQIKLAADGLHQLCEYGDKQGLNVIVENHGGLSSNGQWLSKVMKAVDHPRVGTLPDFGNFRVSKDEVYDRYKGVQELMPYAKSVSAKTHNFNDEGDETETDYYKMMKIVLDGATDKWEKTGKYVGIEYEGGKDQISGIKLTKALLEKVRTKMS